MNTTTRRTFSRQIIQPDPSSDTTKDDAKLAMERMVYEVSGYLERLEDAGKIHAAQKLAQQAAQEVEERWIE